MKRIRRIGVRAALLGLLVSSVLTGAARAQERAEPQLLLTIFGGVAGGATLVQAGTILQPLVQFENPTATDTLALGRRLAPAITFGASASWFPTPHLGLSGEIAFLGFGRDDTCSMAFTDSGPINRGYNDQVCDDIAAKSGAASTIVFQVGGMYRVAPRGALKPYLRAYVGFTTRQSSTVEVTGRFVDDLGVLRERLVIGDADPGTLDPTASFGLGIMIPFAAGYQARLEFRDQLLYARRLTGPADALAVAPTERTMLHSFGLAVMLDIVLEQKRGRRY